MRSKKFPNLSNAISNDDLRPVMNYAVVQDGRIIATGGKNKPFIVTPCDYSSYEHEEFSGSP